MKHILYTLILFSTFTLSAQSTSFGLSIFFEKADYNLSVENTLKLDDFKLLAKDSSYNSVFIKGYADNDGSDEFNLELSEQRVTAVKNYFYGNKYAIDSKCYGEKEAINKNKNEDEKSLNRRVDVIFWTNYALGKNKKQAQVFTFPANRAIEFTAAEGTKIKIPANSLVYENGSAALGDVMIAITEYYSMQDIIQNKLTTNSNGEVLISAGMINIEASRNNKELKLKSGTTMDVGFAEREENDGFGVFYGDPNPATNVINWVPAVDTRTQTEGWFYSGVKLFVSDTIERWRSKLEFNNYGQRIKVTEKWVENIGTNYDTLIVDKTINKNSIILQATKLGWLNCDQFFESPDKTNLYVNIDPKINPDIVLIFGDVKAMLQPAIYKPGMLVFYNVPKDQKIIIAGVGSGEGKLYFTKNECLASQAPSNLQFKESSIEEINQQLSIYH